MSRGRECNIVHVVADDLEQAAEDLCREWAVDRRARWAIGTGTPAREPLDVEHDSAAPAGLSAALQIARQTAERHAYRQVAPPDPRPERAEVERRLAEARRARAELHAGQGRYADTPEDDRARQLAEARHRAGEASRFAADDSCGWRTRRGWAREAKVWEGRLAAAEAAFDHLVGPELERLDETIRNLEVDQGSLIRAQAERDAWLAEHPEADGPKASFDLGDLLDRLRPAAGWQISPEPNTAGMDRGAAVEPDLGIDFGPWHGWRVPAPPWGGETAGAGEVGGASPDPGGPPGRGRRSGHVVGPRPVPGGRRPDRPSGGERGSRLRPE